LPRPPAEILHRRLAQSIIGHLRAAATAPGAKISETALARALGTSRSPVRGALAILLEQGIIEWRQKIGPRQRGRATKDLVLRHLPEAGTALPPSEEVSAAEDLYWRLAADRLAGALPDVVAEADLVRRYGIPRGNVHRILLQILIEGWIERAPAGGWRFLPLIDSAGSYDESYRFRRAIEPAAVLDPAFQLEPRIAAQLRREQSGLIERAAAGTPDPRTVFELNSGFHLALLQASNNRFFADAALRVTRLRRLVGYVIAMDRARLVTQSQEHLAILDRIEAGDRVGAAELLVRHLDAGRASKAKLLEPGRLTVAATIPPISPPDQAA
jgi:DNA-binding GntR family transcriptional regulator